MCKKSMKKAALHNLGCKVNACETQAMQQLLEEAGYQIVPFHEKADVYVVNTCSVTNIADRKSRQMLHRARRQNPQAVIAAVGCYAQASVEEIRKEGIADIIVGNNKKKGLADLLKQYEKSKSPAIGWEDINSGPKEYEQLPAPSSPGHTRAFVKIQDGCSQFCSYCIIPYVRGRVRSRQPDGILAEIRKLAQDGYQEVVLTGIHLSSYGTDFGQEEGSLLRLLHRVHGVDGIKRIRLGSLEPGIMTREFAKELSGMEKICPHFHLSLQSGCDTVLKRMNRKYNTAGYEENCGILREFYKNPAITTDVIAGFPGETEEEFLQTMQFVEKIHFYEMHVFKYSRRKGTKAARMEGQVQEQVKARRSAALIRLGEEMSKEYRESFVGQQKSVLLEEPFIYGGKEYYTGYTAEYLKVAVESGKNLANCIVKGKICGHFARDIYLMVEF